MAARQVQKSQLQELVTLGRKMGLEEEVSAEGEGLRLLSRHYPAWDLPRGLRGLSKEVKDAGAVFLYDGKGWLTLVPALIYLDNRLEVLMSRQRRKQRESSRVEYA
jgi:hypothetical protein